MEVVEVPSARRDEWDGFVSREPSFALTQSWGWGEFKERTGWKPFRVAVERGGRIVAGAQVLVKPSPLHLASVAYVPRGPVGDWLDDQVIDSLLPALHRVARRERTVVLRLEPPLTSDSGCAEALRRLGFRPSGRTNQPRATIVMDLEQGVDAVLAQMHKTTRYSIRYAARQGVTVRIGDAQDLPTFYRLMQMTGRRAGFRIRSYDYYRAQWETFAPAGSLQLLVATHEGEPLAVNMAAAFGRHGAYLHGASSGERASLCPNHLLLWEAIRWSADRGCHTFDLWGIPDEAGLAAAAGRELPKTESTRGLWGVYRFKRGFARDIVLYTAAHDYVYLGRPVRAALARLPGTRD